MTDYAIVSLMMIAAGVMLGIVCLVIRINGNQPEPLPESIPESPLLSSVKDLTPPNKELAKEIVIVYTYSDSGDNAMRTVWVCKNCEVENSATAGKCIVCGSLRS